MSFFFWLADKIQQRFLSFFPRADTQGLQTNTRARPGVSVSGKVLNKAVTVNAHHPSSLPSVV